MDRRTAALAIRDAFTAAGVVVVTHEEWGPIVDWSSNPDSTRERFDRFHVGHHTGGSALLRELQGLVDKGYDPLTVGKEQMANVDHYHYWVRGWRGFAYRGSCLPWKVDGRLVWLEGRSAWISHGAHLNDPEKRDWPTYYMVGAADTALTAAQEEFWAVENEVLSRVFGWTPTRDNQKKHREVQGITTTQCCDPVFGDFIEAYRERIYLMDLIETYGDNRHATLAEAALKHFPTASKVNVAAGDAYADLAAATVVAAREGVPVLSVNRSGPLPTETVAALLTLGTETIELFGGPTAVDGHVREQLRGVN